MWSRTAGWRCRPTTRRRSKILHELHQNGAVLENPTDVELVAAPADKVVPPNFYSTTNHPTEVLYDGEWIDVERIEMDCALIVEPDGGPDGDPRAYTKVLNAVEEDDLVATDQSGIRVNPPERPRSFGGARSASCRAASPLSAPSESTIREVAEEPPRGDRGRRERDGRRRPRGDPLSGAGDALAELVEAGYVDALSAGNGFATHDLERSRCTAPRSGWTWRRSNTRGRATNTTSGPSRRSSARAGSKPPSRTDHRRGRDVPSACKTMSTPCLRARSATTARFRTRSPTRSRRRTRSAIRPTTPTSC